MSIELFKRAYHLGYLQKCAEMEKEASIGTGAIEKIFRTLESPTGRVEVKPMAEAFANTQKKYPKLGDLDAYTDAERKRIMREEVLNTLAPALSKVLPDAGLNTKETSTLGRYALKTGHEVANSLKAGKNIFTLPEGSPWLRKMGDRLMKDSALRERIEKLVAPGSIASAKMQAAAESFDKESRMLKALGLQ